jgi:hypothetical protein
MANDKKLIKKTDVTGEVIRVKVLHMPNGTVRADFQSEHAYSVEYEHTDPFKAETCLVTVQVPTAATKKKDFDDKIKAEKKEKVKTIDIMIPGPGVL